MKNIFTKKPTQISLAILSIIGYGFIVFAAPPSLGGYTPAETLDPSCSPGQSVANGDPFDCFVKSGLLTGNNGLTVTGSNVKLGGVLTSDTDIELDGSDYSITDSSTGMQWLMTQNHPLTGGIMTGLEYTAPNGKNFISGMLQFGDDFHNYQGVLDFSPGGQGETAIEVGYFDNLSIYGSGRQAIFLKGGAASSGSDSTEMFITTNDVFIRAQGNTASDIILRGLAFQGGVPLNDDEVFRFTGDGSATFNYYISSRDDTKDFAPVNFLYTDTTGKILSAPVAALGGSGWGLNGNTGTTAGTNFIGTTDATDFVVKVGGTQKARFYQNSSVAFGGGVALSDFMVVSGLNAGVGSSNARASNWLGINAGSNATNANFSNFLGGNAGVNATNASNSNFLGAAAGYGAADASNSNFLGTDSGNNASNATYSNFLGSASGRSAVNASQSFFVGQNAGRFNQPSTGSPNSSNSIFIGRDTNYTANGFNLNNTVTNTTNGCNTNDCYSILLGNYTNTAGFSNSIAIGAYATNTATNQMMIGSTTRPINELVIKGSGTCSIAATGLSCSSDERLKTNIEDLSTTTLENILKVRTVLYNWKTDPSGNKVIGFLAQDLEQYYPQLVRTDSDGYKMVNYAQMTPILVEAMRELNIKLTAIETVSNTINPTFLTNLRNWLGDVGNGINQLFAKKITTGELCVGSTCINESDLQSFKSWQQSSGGSTVTVPEPQPEVVNETPTPETEVVPEIIPETDIVQQDPILENSEPIVTEPVETE